MMAKASASATSEAVWKTSAIKPPARVPADAGTRCGAIRNAHVLQYLPCAETCQFLSSFGMAALHVHARHA